MKKVLFALGVCPVFFTGQISPHYFNLVTTTGNPSRNWIPMNNFRMAGGNKLVSAVYASGNISSGGAAIINFGLAGNIVWTKPIGNFNTPGKFTENGASVYAFVQNGVNPGILKMNSVNGNTVWSKGFLNANALYNSGGGATVDLFKENLNIAFFFERGDTNGVYHTFLGKTDASGNPQFCKRLDSISPSSVVKVANNYVILGNGNNKNYLVCTDATLNIVWSKQINISAGASLDELSYQNNTIYVHGTQGTNTALLSFDVNGNFLWSRSIYPTTGNILNMYSGEVVYKANKLHLITNYTAASGGNYGMVITMGTNGNYIRNRVLQINSESDYVWDNASCINADTSVFMAANINTGGFGSWQMGALQFDIDGDLEMCVADSAALADSSFTVSVVAASNFSPINEPMTSTNITLTALAEGAAISPFKIQIDSIVPTPAPCSSACGGVETVYYSGLDGNPAFLWSANTGNQNTQSATNLCPGLYGVTLTDMYNCTVTGNNVLIFSPPQTPDICMVTVDSIGTTNYIFWDKSAYSPSDTFIVYRDTANNNYARIGKVPFDSLSQFADTVRSLYAANGDPNVSSWRYKLAVRDSCGNYGAMSPYHQTMFFQNSSGNFSWNHYQIEGQIIPVPTLSNYRFKRDDISNGTWNTIQLLSASSIAYTDPSYGTFSSTASWRVETQWSTTCTPTLKLTPEAMAAVAKSRSNVQNNFAVTGIKTITEKDFILMPNPANDFIVIQSKSTMKNVVVEVYDLTGRLVLTSPTISLLSAGAFSAKEGFQHSININTSGLSNGIYSVRIISENGKAIKKLVIEK